MAISLGKAILAGLAGGTEALATSFEKEDERRLEFTKEGVEASLKNIAAANKLSQERTQKTKEFEDKVDSVASLGIQMPDDNGNMRTLTRSDVGALLQVFDPDEIVEFAENKNLIVSGQAKRIQGEGTTIGGFDAEMAKAIPEGESFVSKGRQDSVQQKISDTLKSRGYNPEGVTIPGAVKYTGLNIQVKGGGEVKRDEDYTFTGVIDGQEVTNVKGFVGNDGMFYINDLRFIDDKPIRATKDKFSNPIPVPKSTENVGNKLPEAVTFVAKRLEDSGYDKMRGEIIRQSAATKTLGNDLESMWEIAQNEEVYSRSVLLVGSLTKTIKREFGGVTFLFNPEDNSAESRQKNVEALGELGEFIANNKNAEDVVTRRKVLDAMVFKAAMTQATDGQSNPSDKDLQGMLQQFQAQGPKEFFQKAQATWQSRTQALQNSYTAYINNNPLARIDLSSMGPEYTQARDIVMSGKTINEADINLSAPMFLQTTDPETLPDKDDVAAIIPDPTATGKKTEEKPAVSLNIEGTPTDATYDPEEDVFRVILNGKRWRVPANQAIDKNMISLEDLKKLQEGQ